MKLKIVIQRTVKYKMLFIFDKQFRRSILINSLSIVTKVTHITYNVWDDARSDLILIHAAALIIFAQTISTV